MADIFHTWVYRLVHSPEWVQLQEAYRRSLAARALDGGFDTEKVAELARDLQGLRAFCLWCENETTRKAGLIDGRARRYEKQARIAAANGSEPGESGR